MRRDRFAVPDRLIRHIEDALGDAGHAWLADLPDALSEACGRWELLALEPFDDLTYGWVAPVRRSDGSAAVLKLGWPDPEARNGMAALRFYAGRGSVRLFDADEQRCWQLMERVEPVHSLAALSDADSARALAAVMASLHRPPPAAHPFPTLGDWWRTGKASWAERRPRPGSALPARLIEWCDRAFRELDSTAVSVAVLHGDLHHRNVLAAGRVPWLSIDPKGVVGDPAFEPGAWLRNPIPEFVGVPDLAARLVDRLDRISDESGLERRRVAAWGAIGSVLSAIWDSTATGRGVPHALACAHVMVAEVDPAATLDG